MPVISARRPVRASTPTPETRADGRGRPVTRRGGAAAPDDRARLRATRGGAHRDR